MPKPLRRLSLAASLLLVVVLSACGGDEPDDAKAGETASASAADSLVQQGLDQLNAGDASAARTTFENVLALDPGNVYGHYNLGLIAQQAGDEELALERYDAALEADEDFTSALYNKAILTESNDLDAAVELYERVLAVEETMAAAHMRLGFALLELGEKADAEEHLARGVELDPAMADVEPPSYD
ncbi:MAG TPA: tetratricopeptide repeat protein [Nocardioides sp.]|uniref:tetratricopeptide repeat protein n=1 Tax=Nocardioides sp. TaxID=35761 RepID=UPI002CC85B22|nr:tetratricopeptide repeat protein [Nocardioides sp.]HTW16396.1 tetratricopeptide repeat protein [Nocardioides sp.]